MNRVIFVICLILHIKPINALELEFVSGNQQTILIELYTSEGCSSCPPADKWLAKFKDNKDLWSKYIPLAFHVDYWDYIGWDDVFADHSFTLRQRKHRRQSNINSVYTPGFVVNGNEWRGFFKTMVSLPESKTQTGILKASINPKHIVIDYAASTEELSFNFAVLGFGLISKIKHGENAGKSLSHDFVVLHHQSQLARQTAIMDLPIISKNQAKKYAIAVWVSQKKSLKPLQATGGFLPEGMIKEI